MRRSRALAAAALCAALAAPAAPARADGVNNLLAGLNGLLTFPADPVMLAMEPPSQIEGLPGAYTEHVVGFLGGTFFGMYRAFLGVWDIAFSPFWILPTVSPEANWDLIPGYELEWE